MKELNPHLPLIRQASYRYTNRLFTTKAFIITHPNLVPLFIGLSEAITSPNSNWFRLRRKLQRLLPVAPPRPHIVERCFQTLWDYQLFPIMTISDRLLLRSTPAATC